jgi:hypothetical protein
LVDITGHAVAGLMSVLSHLRTSKEMPSVVFVMLGPDITVVEVKSELLCENSVALVPRIYFFALRKLLSWIFGDIELLRGGGGVGEKEQGKIKGWIHQGAK